MNEDLLADTPLSVAELNALAKNLLENHLSGLWVAGEVSNLTRAASGHYYFLLKDTDAQVRCTLFKHAAQRLDTPLKEGDQIELSGKISIYEARGEFQINVLNVRQTGLGRLFEQYEKLKNRLQAEGLFAAERKQKLPEFPQRIGVVTSLAAAALRDVASTLKRRAPALPVIVYPTAVQGTGSEQQIAQAIRTAAARREVDILIVCRGGGSIEDLWSFNEEAVVRAIAECPIPTVSGVGHETDFTLTDFAADVRAPTPTAAAELVSYDRIERLRRIDYFQAALRERLQQTWQNAAQKTDWLAARLLHPRRRLQEQRDSLRRCSENLVHLWRRQLDDKRNRIAAAAQNLHFARPDTAAPAQQLIHFQAALQQGWQQLYRSRSETLQRQAALLEAVSPQQIFERGFSVVKNGRGQIIRSADTLKQGQKLHIVFADGETDVRVTKEHAQPDLFDYS